MGSREAPLQFDYYTGGFKPSKTLEKSLGIIDPSMVKGKCRLKPPTALEYVIQGKHLLELSISLDPT